MSVSKLRLEDVTVDMPWSLTTVFDFGQGWSWGSHARVEGEQRWKFPDMAVLMVVGRLADVDGQLREVA